MERKEPRYAHDSKERPDLTFSENGEYIITCGSDGDVRIWKGFEDDDPTEKCVGERAYAVAVKDDKLYVGSDRNNVQIFSFPQCELQGVLTRFTAPVTTIDVSKNGQYVAAGSRDMEIHLINTENSKTTFFSGHKGQIMCVAIDPKMEYIASSSCDGSVKVWNIQDTSVTKEWNDVTPTFNSYYMNNPRCYISWEPVTGRLLAIPMKSGVKLYQRDTWNHIVTLSQDSTSDKMYSLTTWTSCGRFIAGSDGNGGITVWNAALNKLVNHSDCSKNISICALKWNPLTDKRELAYCDSLGQLGIIDNCFTIGRSVVDTSKSTKIPEIENEENDLNGLPGLEETNMDDDDDDENAISLEKIKATYNDENDFPELEGIDDEIGSIASRAATPVPRVPVVDLQTRFQSTSSPAHLQRRFMVFNDVGYVRQTNTTEENTIDVDFHDVSIHHSFRINNLLNHTMASLSENALALACEMQMESSSKIVCILFKTWDCKKEWTVDMPDVEEIHAITTSSNWLAAVTNHRFIRIFTLTGTQKEVLIIPGPVLTINSYKELLIVAYHSGLPLPGEQNIDFVIYEISDSFVEMMGGAQRLPLSEKSTLKWIGFTDFYNISSMDSSGVLQLYNRKRAVWTPIRATKFESSHNFIIGVNEERQNIRCIICKGSYYPSTTPHPFISEVPWQIPLCEDSVDKGVLEEQLCRNKLSLDCIPEEESASVNKELMATALKLFALACQSDHEMRSEEICKLVGSSQLIQLAAKYASKSRKVNLAQRLTRLSDQINSEEMKQKISSRRNDMNFTNGSSGGQASQDMFGDSQESYTSEVDDGKDHADNMILNMKKKILLSQNNEVSQIRKINPFRKSTQLLLPTTSTLTESPNQMLLEPSKERKRKLDSDEGECSSVKTLPQKKNTKLKKFSFSKSSK